MVSYNTWSAYFPVYEQDIEEMQIGTSVTYLDDGVFRGFYNMQRLAIPDSISSPSDIGMGAFYGCDNLTEVWFDGITRADVA
jgi:hypothetical protein